MNIATKRTFVLTLTVACLFAVCQQTIAQKKSAEIETYLQEAHADGLFNGNILVVNQNKTILKKAIGYADATKQTPLTTQYRFHIGSIAKEFDAVGIMMLQEQGQLSVDDKLSKFFPELGAWANQVTVKHLLQYTSGIPNINWKTVHTDADNWKDLQAITDLNFLPGSSYDYNNNNTYLRRRVIEKVSGLSFKEFVLQKILPKANIKNGIIDPTEQDALIAKSFTNDFKQNSLAVPITGWTCLNLDDFYKWSQCIDNFRLINPASTQQIITPAFPSKQCGLGGGTMQGNRVITHVHDGVAMQYQALLSSNTTKGRTIIILTNQRQNNVYYIATAIEAILDGKPYQPLSKAENK